MSWTVRGVGFGALAQWEDVQSGLERVHERSRIGGGGACSGAVGRASNSNGEG